MSSCKIKIPKNFSTSDAQSIIKSLATEYKESFAAETEEVVFDFSECESISPVGLIYIRMWRDCLVDAGKKTFYRKGKETADSFMKKMHLFPRAHYDESEKVEDTFFYHIHCCQNVNECSDAQRNIVSNVVQRGKVPDETYCSVDYMINELWDNAGVHGYECYTTEDYPNPVYICAIEQDTYYEVCIGDRGQGIYKSIQKNNTELQGKNKKDSVKAAIQNGISGHPNGSPGFGLYSSAEFIREGNGSLYIWSSGCYLVISSKDDRIYNTTFDEGTLVSFVIEKTAVLPFGKVLGAKTACTYDAQEYIDEVIGGLFDDQ